ncbi:MAG: hypothetical protein BroJett007_33050 [Chloroflexota bacterium]|nr:MAG: hypothetical protein BroJett007_33050 [Chloroflexota bacterium]
MPITASGDKPTLIANAPKIRPNGAAPATIGATAINPAANSFNRADSGAVSAVVASIAIIIPALNRKL